MVPLIDLLERRWCKCAHPLFLPMLRTRCKGIHESFMGTNYEGGLFFEFSNDKSFEESIMTNHNRYVNSMNWMQIEGTWASLLGKWKWMETPLKFTGRLHDNIIYVIEAIVWCALILVMPSTSVFTLQVSDICMRY
jgi:hypothetical protein